MKAKLDKDRPVFFVWVNEITPYWLQFSSLEEAVEMTAENGGLGVEIFTATPVSLGIFKLQISAVKQ